MAKQIAKDTAAGSGRSLRGVYERARTFIDEVRTELGKVTWPTTEDLKVSTKVTMIMLGIMAAVIFTFDITFARVMLAVLSLAS